MLSVIVPSIRPGNLQRLYESIEASYSGEFEFIVVGPHRTPIFFTDKPRISYYEDYGSPTRAQQIGLTKASGDLVLWGVADDGVFRPGAIDKAVAMRQPHSVLVGKYYEGSDNPAMAERKYYYINTHDCCRSPYIHNDWLMLMVGIVPRQMLLDIGGIDAARFETLPMAFNDLSARLYRAGYDFELMEEVMFRCTHMPGHEGDHGPVHDGQTLHDEGEFRRLYSDWASENRVKIDLGNWTNAPGYWSRRFAHLVSK
jgi:glycosyltransferase involved in cell wall biosynthesis